MSVISSFSDLHNRVCSLSRRIRVAVCQPSDRHTLHAVCQAIEMGFVHAILVGESDADALREIAPEIRQHIEHIALEGDEAAAQKAVRLVHDGEAEVLMKGMVNTDVLLREILNKEHGLRPEGAIISHIAVFETRKLDRLLILSDVAVIPTPNLEQRVAQLTYTTSMARRLGIATPRVAMLHCTEKVSEKFPVTLDYEVLKERASKGEFGSVLIDGPIDLSCSISPDALEQKRLESPIGGKADILIMPDIQAGNILYKTLQCFAEESVSASLLCGTKCPVVITSRGDTIETKINSLALAALPV